MFVMISEMMRLHEVSRVLNNGNILPPSSMKRYLNFEAPIWLVHKMEPILELFQLLTKALTEACESSTTILKDKTAAEQANKYFAASHTLKSFFVNQCLPIFRSEKSYVQTNCFSSWESNVGFFFESSRQEREREREREKKENHHWTKTLKVHPRKFFFLVSFLSRRKFNRRMKSPQLPLAAWLEALDLDCNCDGRVWGLNPGFENSRATEPMYQFSQNQNFFSLSHYLLCSRNT